jgi:hypothetical protein
MEKVITMRLFLKSNKVLVQVFLLMLLLLSSLMVNAQGSGNNLLFNGTNNFVDLGTGVFNGNTFTQEVWVFHTITDNNYHGIIGNQPSGTSNRAPSIWIYQQSRIHAGFGDGTNWNSWTSGTGLVLANRWNHIAVTFDGTNYLLYVNGILVHSSTVPAGRTPLAGRNVRWIGRVDNYFQGNIDEVRLWNTVRTPTQIRDNMTKKLMGSEVNLVGYWRLDENSGSAVLPTGIGSTGALSNAPTRALSSAPIGDESAYLYTNSWSGQSVTLSSAGQGTFTVNSITGTPSAIYVYRVDAIPSSISGLSGLGNNNSYFGAFVVGGTASTFTSVYDYSNFTSALSDEANLVLNTRTHNAITSWSNAGATLNLPSNTFTQSNVASRGEFILSNPTTPLPVTLMSFNAERQNNQHVQLTWETASEQNNNYFTVERSSDGQVFEVVGQVEGAGTSTSMLSYALVDEKPYHTISYYRLKQTDFDGTSVYSKVIAVYGSNNTNQIMSVYPNPNQGQAIYIQLNTTSVDAVQVNITNHVGQIVYSENFTSMTNNDVVTIEPVNPLTTGLYTLTVTTAGNAFTEKLLVR